MATAVTLAAESADTRAAIVVIGPVPPPFHGGSVATAYVLASGLTQQWRVLHLDTTDRRGLENIGQLDMRNVGLALRHAAALLRLLIAERPAAVYVALAQNTLAVLRDAGFIVPALLAGSRVVIHLHGGGFRDYYEGAPAPVRWLVRSLLARASRVIVLGESLRASVAGLVPAERTAVLPNGIPDAFGAAPVRAHSGALRVLFLGNLVREKGALELVEAVRALRAAGVELELDIAGGAGPDGHADVLRDAVARLGPAARLHGVVQGERKKQLLAAADIFAFPTYYPNEAHPYVVLEAMSAALPVVTTPRAALRETVIDGETGCIVPERDTTALADALRRLAADASLRERLGNAARVRYEEQYSLECWSRGLCRVVGEALA